jgi:hypothetical protein
VAPSTAGLDLREPISRLSGFPKCGRATDIVSSSADASRLKKKNFMSDKKKQLFSTVYFVLVPPPPPSTRRTRDKTALFSTLKKTVKKSFPFFLSNK